MGGDHAVDAEWRQPGGDEGGSAGDEAVEDDDQSGGRSAESDTDEEADLEPTDGSEDGDGVVRVWLVDGQHALDDRGLARSEEHTSELQSHHDLVCRLL